MKILGLDFETTDKDPKVARPIEIGALLVDDSYTLPESADVTNCCSTLIYDPEYSQLSAEIQEVTHITPDELINKGTIFTKAWDALTVLLTQADYVIAYNAIYDKTVYESECKRRNVPALHKEWLCAMTDVPYPAKYRCKQLSHLALDHGIIVNPAALHRALGDVCLMFQLLKHGDYTISSVLQYRNEPWIYIRAVVSYEERQLAKDRRFMWEKAGDSYFPKTWVKRIKASELERERKDAPFMIATI